ncbi:MAG: hypothetical protein ACR65X_00825 [Methylocystis sp.]
MAQLETRLIASLTDRINALACKASESLKGLSKAANIKLGGGGVFSGLHREIGHVNRQLDQMRGRMIDSVAQLYIAKNALAAPIKAAATTRSQQEVPDAMDNLVGRGLN